MKTDVTSWYSKSEAMAKLEKGERTLQRYVEAGKIEQRLRQVQGRKAEPVYNPVDVDREAAKLEKAHIVKATLDNTPLTLGLVDQVVERIARKLAPMTYTRLPLLLTLEEAARYTGHSKRILKQMAREISGLAHKDRGWKFHRGQLEQILGYNATLTATETTPQLDKGRQKVLGSRLEQ